ncbi:MAG: TetR/AcrR family transcriptional regulator [Bacteroidota bacterium]
MQEKTTRERLVEVTANLIRAKGYYGTGITEILRATGVPKGSLYHHFPSGKDGLVVESIHFSSKEMLREYEMAMRGTRDPVNGLGAIVDVLAQRLERSGFRDACPLATVALEMNDEKPAIRAACKSMYQMWQDALLGYFALKQVGDARRKARVFLTLLEGGFVLAKAHQDADFLLKVKEDVADLLKD